MNELRKVIAVQWSIYDPLSFYFEDEFKKTEKGHDLMDIESIDIEEGYEIYVRKI